MVSEDSQNLGWFPVIHRLLDLCYLDDSIERHMSSKLHQFDDACELLEVLSLRSPQWVLHEERNDLGAKVIEPIDVVPEKMLAVIVTPSVDVDLPASKEVNQFFKHITAGLSLNYIECRPNLPFESHPVIAINGAAETALSIHETHDPSCGLESFLLIFRRGPCQPPTLRIVTAAHVITVLKGCDRKSASTEWIHRVFQHLAGCTHQRHRWEGQQSLACTARGFFYLRHSVTSTRMILSGGAIISAALLMSP